MDAEKGYRKRVADEQVELLLETAGVVVIEGPKWCGKTTTARQHAKSVLLMDNPELMEQNGRIAEIDLLLLLKGDTPRLVDEWQIAPTLWDAARYEVDQRGEFGQFIFTGSAVPADRSSIHHTGVGRFAWVRMRTMSLWESGDSVGTCSLDAMFNGVQQSAVSKNHTLENICHLICRGGWPQSLKVSPRAALLIARNYVDAVAKQEMSDTDGIVRSEATARALLRSYARHQGTSVSVDALLADMNAKDDFKMSDKTLREYLEALRRIFVVEDMEAWNPNLRSKTAVRTSNTRYFVDPSIATAALGVSPGDLLKDLNTLGLFFETMAVRDLRVYADALDGNVYHYRDSTGLECDAVMHLRNGHFALIEVKLGGGTLIEEGAKNLLKLQAKLNTQHAPSFLAVLTATGQYVYKREDSVWVIPIGALRP